MYSLEGARVLTQLALAESVYSHHSQPCLWAAEVTAAAFFLKVDSCVYWFYTKAEQENPLLVYSCLQRAASFSRLGRSQPLFMEYFYVYKSLISHFSSEAASRARHMWRRRPAAVPLVTLPPETGLPSIVQAIMLGFLVTQLSPGKSSS